MSTPPLTEVARWPIRLGVITTSLALATVVPAALAPAAMASATDYTVTATVPVGTTPTSVVLADGKLYVANHGSNTVSVVDPTSYAVTGTIPAGASVYGLASDSGFVYTTDYGANTSSIIDTTTNSIVATVPVGAGPASVLVANGHAFVTNEAGGTVTIYNTSSRTVTDTLAVGGFPFGLAVAGGKVYVSNLHPSLPQLDVIDVATRVLETPITVPGNSRFIAASAGYVYLNIEGSPANTMVRVNTANPASQTLVSLPVLPTGIAVNDDSVFISSYGDDRVLVLDKATLTVAHTISVAGSPSTIRAYGSKAYVTAQTGNALVVIALPATAGSSTSATAESQPEAWFLSMGREGETCPTGWSPSWAEWPNEGRGGAVCNSFLVYSDAQWWTTPDLRLGDRTPWAPPQ